MPAKGRKTTLSNCRKKVGLTAEQAARLQSEADASDVTESAYIVRILTDAWRAADSVAETPAGSSAVNVQQPSLTMKDRRKRVTFSAQRLTKLRSVATSCGITEARYIHDVVSASIGEGKPPKRSPTADAKTLAANLNLLAWQVSKLGTNVNQLAKQANEGMVQIGRGEVQYLLNQHQVLFSKAAAALEQVLK